MTTLGTLLMVGEHACAGRSLGFVVHVLPSVGIGHGTSTSWEFVVGQIIDVVGCVNVSKANETTPPKHSGGRQW